MRTTLSSNKYINLFSALALVSTLGACGEKDDGGGDDSGVLSETGGTLTGTTSPTTTTDTDASTTADTDASTTDASTTDASTTDATTTTGDPTTTGTMGECGLDGLTDPGPQGAAAGQPVYHFTELAHTGEMVNICEFAGKKMMLDLSAGWCGPCQMAADCIAGNNGSGMQLFTNYSAQTQTMIDGIRNNLIAGNTNWVTVFYQNAGGSPPSLADIQAWESNYSQENVWVMAETAGVSQQWLPTQGIPFFVSVGADFNYLNVNNGYEWSDMANP
jgi:thiol-disulfide isomerase/thioredoxin